jgi:hypothetical protein
MFPLGVLKKKQLKILKLTFTGAVVNEASTASNTQILQDGSVSIAGNKLNLNGSSDCSVQIKQISGSDWFSLQRDFDLTFDLVVVTNSPAGGIIHIMDYSQDSLFQLQYENTGNGVLQLIHGGQPNTGFATSALFGAIPKGTPLAIKIEYRRTSAKLYINSVLAIDATGLLQRTNIIRDLWLGGAWAGNTISGSMDNVEMTLL